MLDEPEDAHPHPGLYWVEILTVVFLPKLGEKSLQFLWVVCR